MRAENVGSGRVLENFKRKVEVKIDSSFRGEENCSFAKKKNSFSAGKNCPCLIRSFVVWEKRGGASLVPSIPTVDALVIPTFSFHETSCEWRTVHIS